MTAAAASAERAPWLPPDAALATAPRLLTIAGSDSCGGAGLQADLKTFLVLGCHGMSVVTAVTAQNTSGVAERLDLPSHLVRSQLVAVLEDLGADAIKIGMLGSADNVARVAEVLADRREVPLVLDPVMRSGTGAPLLDPEAERTLIERLLPLADVVTPNLPEAERLLGRPVRTLEERRAAARELSDGGRAALIKGGHGDDDPVVDVLCFEGECVTFERPRRVAGPVHGTGCTLAAALAAWLARGYAMREAVRRAIDLVQRAIGGGARLGAGQLLLDPWAAGRIPD